MPWHPVAVANSLDLDPNQVKHLELVQAVIGRLAGNSFLIKGWSVTVVGAFLGFAVTREEPDLVRVSLLPLALFWGLDTYFLRAERLFRVLYDRVRQADERVAPFAMSATGKIFRAGLDDNEKKAGSWWRTAFSLTLLLLYGGLAISAIVVGALICQH